MSEKRGIDRTVALLALLVTATLGAAFLMDFGLPWKHSNAASKVSKKAPQVDYRYYGAEPEVREFLIKAKAASSIEDPYRRCLAFPDIPGNQWPAGLTRAHCLFAYGPRITAEDIEYRVRNRLFTNLDVIYSRDLARHFSDVDFSEVIHSDFDEIEANEEWNKLTKAWLDQAPNSPYAQAIRARYLQLMARAARGRQFAADTPKSDLQRMSKLAQQSIYLYEKALTSEPRLMPAYGALINLGMIDSQPELMRHAFEAATAVDPDCFAVNNVAMIALRPEWGGSYPQMISLSHRLLADMARRPLLALPMIAPLVAKSEALIGAKRYDDSAEILSVAAVHSTDPGIFEDLAMVLRDGGQWNKSSWKILMYELESSRFEVPSEEITSHLGMHLGFIDPQWSISILKSAIAKRPDDAQAHLLLAQDYETLNRPADAEQEYRVVVEKPEQRADALLGLFRLAVQEKKPVIARGYYEAIAKEFPERLVGITAP